MLSALTSIQLIDNNLARSQATTASDPTVKRETSYYLANIGSIKTSKDFVNNYQLFSYAMTAYGLSDLTYAKSMMQKVMDGGVSNPKSIANQMSDPRFKAFAQAFDFGDKGAAATSNAANNKATTSMFVEQTLENNVGQQNQGAQLALYFQREAPKITSGLQILGDKALFQFVQTAFDIPPVASSNALDQAGKNIESKINMADLKDPAKVQKMVTRFAAMWDMQNTDPTATNPALAVFAASSSASSPTISSDLLLQAQRLYGNF